jgi:hypothetical protein
MLDELDRSLGCVVWQQAGLCGGVDGPLASPKMPPS